jgi:hypothetical protein
MMKRLALFSAVIFLSVASFAAVDAIPFVFTDVSNSASVGTCVTSGPVMGFVEDVLVDVSNPYEPIYITGATNPIVANGYFLLTGTNDSGSNTYANTTSSWYLAYDTNDSVWTVYTTNLTAGCRWTNAVLAASDWAPSGSTVTGNLVSASATVDIDVDVTTINPFGNTRTIFSKDDITADGEYPIRIPCTTTSGVAVAETNALMAVAGERIKVTAYDASYRHMNVTLWLLISR